jgi:hypothetical protein
VAFAVLCADGSDKTVLPDVDALIKCHVDVDDCIAA